ncbi:MAG: DUF3135 domain-containing protein [Desulfurivibrionaceae bacterium]
MKNRMEKSEEILAQLQGLYQTDPDRFEKLRSELIRQTVESFPAGHKEQAYRLQFQLDARLRKYKDPVVRMNKMVEIFWQQFWQFREVLNNPDSTIKALKEQKKETTVIPFRKRRKGGQF